MIEHAPPTVPRIYAISPVVQRLTLLHRAAALAVTMTCLAVLVTAVIIRPNPAGVESHRQLGLAECQFLRASGIPCPSCGMTTSFTWFVRGNLVASLWVQPMGTLLAAGAAMTFWAGLYMAVTAKPLLRLLHGTPGSYYVLVPVALGICAWGWKIFIHLRGTDGWR